MQETPEIPATSDSPTTLESPEVGYTYGAPTIIPAAPSTIAIVLHCDYPKNERPTIEDVSTHETFVIAWRIVYGYVPTPIFIDRIYGDDEITWRLRLPDGRLTWPGVADYANLDEAKDHYLQDHQYMWDAKRSQPTAAELHAPPKPTAPPETYEE